MDEGCIHIKNYSLLYSDDMRTIRLAPAYDIICTLVYKTTEQMPFYIGGLLNIQDMNRSSFAKAAIEVGLGPKMAMQRFEHLHAQVLSAVDEVAAQMTANGYPEAEHVRDTIVKHISAIG